MVNRERIWREDIRELHISILQILARQQARKSLHYSRITQKLNYEAGLFTKPVEAQFKHGSVGRRLVELRRRGYVQMTDRGKNRITDEGIAYLEAIYKMPPTLQDSNQDEEYKRKVGEGLGITTRPEGEKATNISKSKRSKTKVRDVPAPQKTFDFFLSGTVNVG